MILIILGTQKFQFNRLLKEVDRLIAKKKINEDVFAQVGYSNYKPINFKYCKFLTYDLLQEYIKNSDIVISHAGTGSIMNSLKYQKKVIAVPRLAQYKEHVDDHQVQIIDEFNKLNLLEAVYNVDDLEKALNNVRKQKYNKYVSNTNTIIDSINNYINN